MGIVLVFGEIIQIVDIVSLLRNHVAFFVAKTGFQSAKSSGSKGGGRHF